MNRQGDIRAHLISQTAPRRSPKPRDRAAALAVHVISSLRGADASVGMKLSDSCPLLSERLQSCGGDLAVLGNGASTDG